MAKVFFAVVLLFLLIPVDLSFAQEPGGVKIYSGCLHQYKVKSKASFWHFFFSPAFPKQEEIVPQKQCSVEFKSPISFSHQSVDVLPQELTYTVTFKNDPQSSEDGPQTPKDGFEKFLVKIYTNDDQEYTIDPEAQGKQVGINEEHQIFDSYLIYLVLGTEIDHLEIVSASGGDQDKYVLDKLEIHG